MKTLSIAFLTQDFQGPQTFSINYYIAVLLHFLRRRYSVERAVIFSQRGGDYACRSVQEVMIDHGIATMPAGVHAVTLDAVAADDPRVFEEFDLVVCTMYWWGDVLETLVDRGCRPWIVYWLPSLLMHECFAMRRRPWPEIELRFNLQKKCVAAADHVVFNSHADRNRGYAYYGGEALAKSSVIYPVSMSLDVRRQKECCEGVQFGYAGRWDIRKGIDLMVEAFFRFYCRQGGTLMITSDFLDHGYDPGDLLDRAAARKLEALRAAGAVKFCPWRSNRGEYLSEMARCDVILVPSLYDPFNIVAFDAMCMGIPTVLSRFCGVEEVVPQENTRVAKINPCDLREFDEAVSRMVRVSELAPDADPSAELSYDVKSMIDETFDLFDSLLDRHQPGRRGMTPALTMPK